MIEKQNKEIFNICEKILSNDEKYSKLQKECNSAYKCVVEDLSKFSNKTCELMEYSQKLLLNKIISNQNK